MIACHLCGKPITVTVYGDRLVALDLDGRLHRPRCPKMRRRQRRRREERGR